jgi:hypothetical protein
MLNSMTFTDNKIAKNLSSKIDALSVELFGRQLLKNCSDNDKMKISVILNEIKYDANRIKNFRFSK